MKLKEVMNLVRTRPTDKIRGYMNKLGVVIYNATTQEYFIYRKDKTNEV